jgi:hypothetical protein
VNQEKHPAIELGPAAEADDSTGWPALAAGALGFGAVAVALALPDLWESWVVDNDSRRFGGLLDRAESIGQWPVVTVVGLVAALFVAALVHELRSDRTTAHTKEK